MTNYRDYVSLGYLDRNQRPRAGATINVPIEQPTTQVFKATHDGAGNRLSRMNRAFISFTYGGKYIEDFGFIATISSNMMTGSAYAEFSDQVTESEVFDGQIYWSTHYDKNSINFELATDGITENEFDNFKAWFKPGVIRELVLMERPNRGILARVAEVPNFNMIPFGHNISVKLGGKEYETKTTLYKGTISLSFVMDDPFWYSLTNFLCYEEVLDGYHFIIPTMYKDALKMIVEDGIPIADSLFGDDWVSKAYSNELNEHAILIGDNNFAIYNNNDDYGSYVANNLETTGAKANNGHVAFPFVRNNNSEPVGINFKAGDSNALYLYYAGNAPSYPVIKFSIRPRLYLANEQQGSSETPLFVYNESMIMLPANGLGGQQTPYNTITAISQNTHIFKFTLPSIWQGYNQAINVLFKSKNKNLSSEELRQLIREEVKHFAPRNYAIACINTIANNSSNVNSNLANIAKAMRKFLPKVNNSVDSSLCLSADFTFDGENHKAEGIIHYMVKNSNGTDSEQIIIEDVSDMLKSPYLYLDEKNILDSNGYIQKYSISHPEYGYKLLSNYGTGENYVNIYFLENFSLKYKFKYR